MVAKQKKASRLARFNRTSCVCSCLGGKKKRKKDAMFDHIAIGCALLTDQRPSVFGDKSTTRMMFNFYQTVRFVQCSLNYYALSTRFECAKHSVIISNALQFDRTHFDLHMSP